MYKLTIIVHARTAPSKNWVNLKKLKILYLGQFTWAQKKMY